MTIAPSESLKQDALDALRRGKHKKALRCFSALEKLEPENGEWCYHMGLIYHRMGKPRRAVEALERAARRCHVQGQTDKAERIYREVLQLDPERSSAQRGLKALHTRGLQPRMPSPTPAAAAEPTLATPPQSSATFGAVSTSHADDVCGFGLPKSKADRVALALAALKA